MEDVKERLERREWELRMETGEECECCGIPLMPDEYRICELCAISGCKKYVYLDPDEHEFEYITSGY